LTNEKKRKEAEEACTTHNIEVAEQTLYPTADSWYMNENIEDKPTVFTPYMGGVDVYHQTIFNQRENLGVYPEREYHPRSSRKRI
jgi:hypothetical protein